MRFSQLGAVAALGVVSQAFLIPPTISEADTDVIKTLPIENAVAMDGRVIDINCPGCQFPLEKVPAELADSSAPLNKQLRFDFTIEHGEGEGDKLMLNGNQLYPVDPIAQTFIEPLRADLRLETSEGMTTVDTPKLGYSLSVEHPTAAEDQISLVALRFEVVEIDQVFISGFPVIELKMLETASGKLMIGDSAVTPGLPLVTEGQECTTILCKWRAIVAGKISQMKGSLKKGGCHGKRPSGHGPKFSGARPAGTEDAPMRRPGHIRPHHGQRPHHFHHRHGGFARFLRNIVFHVFIPIMIGVVVGMSAGLVGLVVGHFIVFVWRVVFRRGQRAQYSRVEQEEYIVSPKEAESDLPPPVYEDAPEYTDAAAYENEKA